MQALKSNRGKFVASSLVDMENQNHLLGGALQYEMGDPVVPSEKELRDATKDFLSSQLGLYEATDINVLTTELVKFFDWTIA